MRCVGEDERNSFCCMRHIIIVIRQFVVMLLFFSLHLRHSVCQRSERIQICTTFFFLFSVLNFIFQCNAFGDGVRCRDTRFDVLNCMYGNYIRFIKHLAIPTVYHVIYIVKVSSFFAKRSKQMENRRPMQISNLHSSKSA